MGGGHQTRLCPDRARSNPAEGSADFPQARCHFSLNNSYEESNSSSAFVLIFGAPLFSPSHPDFSSPSCSCSFFLVSGLLLHKLHSVMTGILQNCLTSCGAPLAEGCWMMGGPSGEILATAVVGWGGLGWPRMQYGWKENHLMLRKHLAPRVIR